MGDSDDYRIYDHRRRGDDSHTHRRELDLLNATVFGVKGQGGVLRALDQISHQVRRNTQIVVVSALAMTSAIIALAVAIAQHG